MDYFKNRDLGFDKEAIISVSIPNKEKRDILLQQLKSNPGVKEVSLGLGSPVVSRAWTDYSAPELGLPKGDVTELKIGDERYMNMFKLAMVAGEPIEKKAEKDSTYKAVVNETLMHNLNITDPQKIINKYITVNGWHTLVTGVMKDFQAESRHKKIRPCVLMYLPDAFVTACIKLQPVGMTSTISRIDKDWSALFPNGIFQYEFLDDHIANWYRQEEKQYASFKMFSGIAIFICCLGLYGLVAFAAAQRTKEVGVRKVLGASLSDIVLLFSKEFVVLILISFLIAAPLSYYVMNNWLHNFAYQIHINAGIFAIAILVSAFVAGITISYQAIKAGLVNPVNSLRTE
jgi:putative ABC transport system permease protein